MAVKLQEGEDLVMHSVLGKAGSLIQMLNWSQENRKSYFLII